MVEFKKNLVEKVAAHKRLIYGLILIIAVAAVIYLNHQGVFSVKLAIAYLQEHEVAAPFIFIALYVVMVVCLLPTLPLNLGAGFLWGTLWGTSYSAVGASVGALACFLISRYLIRDFLNDKFTHSAWVWMQKEVKEKDWKLVAFTRSNPIFPFGLTNYFFGVTKIPLSRYLFGTTVFTIPLSLIVSAIGASMHDLAFDGGVTIVTRNILLVGIGVTFLLVSKLVLTEKSIK